MEQILELISKDIKDSIDFDPKKSKSLQYELSVYSDKASELFFVYLNKSKEYVLLTYSLLNQNLKSKAKLPLTSTQEIRQVILHSINQDHLCLLGLSSIHVIKSLSDYTKDNSLHGLKDSIFHLSLGRVQILQFSFSYYDYYFGALLSDNTFIFETIIQHSQSKFNQIPLSESCIISFSFIPFQPSGWENFMLLFLKSNGALYLSGPLFPEQFTIDKDYLLRMKEINARKKQEALSKDPCDMTGSEQVSEEQVDYQNDFLLRNIQEGLKNSFKTTVLIKSSELMKKFNSVLFFAELQLGNNAGLSGRDEAKYKQLFVLEGLPITILSIAMDNSIDVLVAIGDFNPIRKESCKVIKALYHIEHIDSLEKGLASSRLKLIQMNREVMMLVLMGNVYQIKMRYPNQLRELLEGKVQNGNARFQFESEVVQLIRHSFNDKNINDGSIGYYFIGKVFGQVAFITFFNRVFVQGALQLVDSSQNVFNKGTRKEESRVDKSMQPKSNPPRPQLGASQYSFNTKKSSDPAKVIVVPELKNEFANYSNNYKDIIPTLNSLLPNQMNHLLILLTRSKELTNNLQKKYSSYLNSLETIDALTKEVVAKRKTIALKLNQLTLSISKIAKEKINATDTIIKHRLQMLRAQADEFASSIESIKECINRNDKGIQLPGEVNLYGVSINNLNSKDSFNNEINHLKEKVMIMLTGMLYLSNNKAIES